MRCLIIAFGLFWLLSFSIYAQEEIRSYFVPKVNYTNDIITNFTGGDRRTTQMMGLLNAGIGLNSDSAHSWKGGLFNFEILSSHGKGMSTTNLQDLQVISNIEAGNHPFVFWELWYQQRVGRVALRFGLQDVDNEFMIHPYTSYFSSSSLTVIPTMTLNYSLPTYPTSSLGFSVLYSPKDNLRIITTVFNGKVPDINVDRLNSKWRFRPKSDGLLFVSEVKYTYTINDSRVLGEVALGGAYNNNKTIHSFTDSDKKPKGNYTLYAFGQRELFYLKDKSIGVFSQVSFAPRDRNMAYGYLSAGGVAKGFLSSSHEDCIGIGLCHLFFQETGNNAKTNRRTESAIETFVYLPLTERFSIKPTFYTIISSPKTTIHAAMIRCIVDIF